MRFLRVWVRALVEGARDPNARPLYIAFGGLLLTGTVFYTIVERWRPLDALYFSVTTLATVGFGDYAPKTDLGKGFTIVYILAGIGVIVAFANAVLERAGTAQREKLERAARPQYPESDA
jgi:hypothetical protein